MFVLHETAAGELRQRGPLRVNDGVVVEGEGVVRLDFEDADAAYYVALDPNELKARWPIFVAEAGDQIQFEATNETCVNGRRSANSLAVPIAAPFAFVSILQGDDTGASVDLSTRFSVRLPIDDESCIGHRAPRFTAFGSTLHLLPPEIELSGELPEEVGTDARILNQPSLLGPDRVLVSSPVLLLVLDRGEPFMDLPERVWPVSRIPNPQNLGGYWFVKGMVVDPISVRPDYARIIVAVERLLSGVDWSVVFELEWTPAGFSEPRTLGEFPVRVESLDLDGAGRFVALGDDGLVFVGGPGFEPPRQVDMNGGTGNLRGLTAGYDADEPHIILASSSVLLFGDLERPEAFRVDAPTGSWSRTARAFSSQPAAGGGSDVYLSPDSSELWRQRPDRERELLRFGLPEVAAACTLTVDECGTRSANGSISDLVPTAQGTMLMVSHSCSLVLEYDDDRRCARALQFEELEIAPRDQRFLTHGTISDGQLVVVGALGLVAVAPWPGEAGR